MSSSDRLVAGVSTSWARLLRSDATWFFGVGSAALLCGILGDQIFRGPPLGLRYQTPAERIVDALPSGAAIPSIGIEETELLLTDPKVVLLDARPDVFFEMGHLPGARSLSREQFESDFTALDASSTLQGKTLLVYCTDISCEDGAIVARTLRQRGLGPVRLFQGGFAEWEAAGKPVEVSR